MSYSRTGSTETAAAKAGFSTSTGYRIMRDPERPSKGGEPRGRRRPDPLADIFDTEVVPMLEAEPGLRPVAVFREMVLRHPDLDPGVRRTLERRIRSWKALHGPEREVMFPQTKVAGRLGISDFTRMNALGVTVGGEPLDHMLYHFRLPWSGFAHASVVLGGESFQALSEGLQDALGTVGGVPEEHRTDSLSAAFRNLSRDAAGDLTRRYGELCSHYGMTPTRNSPGVSHENGAIESAHGHLKREVADALALRGSVDFPDLDAYRAFIAGIVGRANARRDRAVRDERARLKPLPERLPAGFEEHRVRVTSSSGFILKGVFYTAPSRLIGHRLVVRLHDDRLELLLGGTLAGTLPRRRKGKGPGTAHQVDYRHVIHSLKAKPGALMRLAYRDGLFPREAFRLCFERALDELGEREACRLAVRLLALAHEENCEAALAAEIEGCLRSGRLPQVDRLRTRFAPAGGAVPGVCVAAAALADYGALLGAEAGT